MNRSGCLGMCVVVRTYPPVSEDNRSCDQVCAPCRHEVRGSKTVVSIKERTTSIDMRLSDSYAVVSRSDEIAGLEAAELSEPVLVGLAQRFIATWRRKPWNGGTK
jgi:hypothetical protein